MSREWYVICGICKFACVAEQSAAIVIVHMIYIERGAIWKICNSLTEGGKLFADNC